MFNQTGWGERGAFAMSRIGDRACNGGNGLFVGGLNVISSVPVFDGTKPVRQEEPL